jgi:ribosomal protein S27E
MIEEVVALDGNAAAGPLTALFAVEPTTMMITCERCGREGPLATLNLYGGAMGMILRCPECGTANLRFTEAGGRVTVDLRGSARLTVPTPEA